MLEPDDAGIADLLTSLRFEAPPLEAVWAPNRKTRRLSSSSLAVAAALIAIVALSAGLVAASSGWFNQLLPNGCAQGDQLCGVDYTQAAIAVDHTTNVTMVNILVRPGLSLARLSEIAATVARKNPAHRVIVYLFDDLPPGPMAAGFAGVPADDSATAVQPPANLLPYWVMTYDEGPSGTHETHP